MYIRFENVQENMCTAKKRDKQSVEDEQSEVSNKDAIVQFAEVISQDILEKNLNTIDSFELYAHQLKTHLHSNPDLFKFRFSEGYRILLEELKSAPIT